MFTRNIVSSCLILEERRLIKHSRITELWAFCIYFPCFNSFQFKTASTLSMWSRCSFTSSRKPEGMFLSLSLKGLGLSLQFYALHPISPSSSVKISWYSTSKFRALSLFSSIQDSRPKSLSFSKRTLLLSLTDSPAHPSLVHLWVQRVPTEPSATTVLGTSLALTILATVV